ncbi:MAG: PhoU domain-containing protein [Thermoplasmatota archaeon]
METRKVQISGGSTYIVSLPKKWAEKSGIKNGSTVNIIEDRGGNLLVSPQPISFKEAVTAEIKITGDESPEAVMRRLVGAYVSGVTGMVVSAPKTIPPQICRSVREFTRLVMGVEIVEERKDQIRLQDLIDPADFSMKEGLKRMAYITEKMVEDSLKGLKVEDEAMMEDVIARDLEADRIGWLIHKEYSMVNIFPRLSGKNMMSSNETLNLLLISRILERVADHAVGIAETAMKGDVHNQDGISESIYKEGRDAKKIFSDSIKALFSQDLNLANSVIDRSRHIKERIDPILRRVYTLPSDEAVNLAFILNSIERIAAYGADIGKAVLNRTYSSGR